MKTLFIARAVAGVLAWTLAADSYGQDTTLTVDQIKLRVSAQIVREGAPYLDVKVTAFNPTPGQVQIEIPDCAVNVLIYDRKDSARKLLWSSWRQKIPGPPRAAGRTCHPGVVEMSLKGGDSIRAGPLTYNSLILHILGDTIREGEYAAEVTVDISGKRTTIDAGLLSIKQLPYDDHERPVIPSSLDSSLRRVKYRVQSGIEGSAPASYAVRVSAENRGKKAAYLEYGDCALTIFGYRSARRSGIPAWRSDRSAPPWYKGITGTCLAYLAITYLLPRTSQSPREFNRAIPTYEILADSLPEGVYYFNAELRINSKIILLKAGSAFIKRQQDPVPPSRTFHGISYSASVRRITTQSAVDSLEFVVLIRNESSVSKIVDGRAQCVPVAGFDSRELRDSWYMRSARTYHWSARPCPLHLPQLTIDPGETRTLRGRTAAPQSPLHYALWLTVIVSGEGDQREGEDFALSAEEAGSYPSTTIPSRPRPYDPPS